MDAKLNRGQPASKNSKMRGQISSAGQQAAETPNFSTSRRDLDPCFLAKTLSVGGILCSSVIPSVENDQAIAHRVVLPCFAPVQGPRSGLKAGVVGMGAPGKTLWS